MPSFFSRFKRKSKSHEAEPATSAPTSPARIERPATKTHTTPPQHHDAHNEHPLPNLPSTTATEVASDPRLSHTVAAHNTEIVPDMRDMTIDSPPQLPPLRLHSNNLATTFASSAQPSLVQSAVNEPALETQRDALVGEIATAAKARKSELSAEGKAAFDAAGMEVAAGLLEVETRYMKPVVQETVIIREHTETTTIIDQHIHRHHVYPKIQPISDPNPIQLEPLHRICDSNGKWHEVIGDAAAIAILGEDVFYNGKKEVREDRKMALPGLGGEVDEKAMEPRVIEREGIAGEMGSWHQLKGLAGAETPSRMVGEGWMLPEEEMGAVRKTVGIAL